MATVGFTAAAKLAGVSRQHLYKLAESGQISVTKELIPGKTGDNPKDYRQMVDISELRRTFPELMTGDSVASENRTSVEGTVQVLKTELQALRLLLSERDEQMQKAHEREEWLKNIITESQNVIKLIGHSVPSDSIPREKYNHIIRKGQAKIDRLQDELWQSQRRGFLARLLNW